MDNSPGFFPEFRIQLLDVSAIVIGYGLAAVFFRAFWPREAISPAISLFAIGLYVWLGLAMSGPLLLLRRRRPLSEPKPASGVENAVQPPARTWAEMAWLLIGVYWIVLGVFVLPIRLHSFQFSDTVLFGLIPLLAGLVFRLFGPEDVQTGNASKPWTHHLAVALLVTWPIAWVCLIVVGGVVL
ncbi:MAG: hypothetical protein ACP5XB_14180 [Isosphaeraceae bacterium]